MKNVNSNKISVFLAAKLREKANKFITIKLNEHGLSDISPSHGDILAVLFDEKPHDMSEIAKRINRTKPTVTVLVEKLEANGYVKRVKSDDDARVTLISLSDKSIALKPIFEQIANELNSIVYKGFSDIEADILEKLLKKAVSNFN